MRSCGAKPRRIKTLAGEVAYERTVYECPSCRGSHAPLDREMSVTKGQKMSGRLVRKVAWSGARHPFKDAAADVREMTGIEVSPAECHRVAQEHGARIEAIQRADEAQRLAPVSPEHPAPPPEIACERLVLEGDAAAVLTRADEEHKMVWCGRAFAVEAQGCKEGPSARRFLTESRHVGSAQNMEDFGGRLKALSFRMGARTALAMAFIADGAACLWKWAGETLPPGTVMIQDFWHVTEHFATLIREVWGESESSKLMLERWKTALRASRLDDVLDELRAEQKKRRGAKRTQLDKQIAYLENGRHRMDYARFEAEGWPIGSGAIEADCKHLVKERFDKTGARWRRSGIAPVLALRQAIFNEEWDRVWELN